MIWKWIKSDLEIGQKSLNHLREGLCGYCQRKKYKRSVEPQQEQQVERKDLIKIVSAKEKKKNGRKVKNEFRSVSFSAQKEKKKRKE